MSNIDQKRTANSKPIQFGAFYANSDQFSQIFREGMALVEETAHYLDHEGRTEAKALPQRLALLYAEESMRLTTRLMQMASWLLIQRAVNEGEMTRQQANQEKVKVKLQNISRPSHIENFKLLPARLQSLVEDSYLLYNRLVMLDKIVHEDEEQVNKAKAFNPLAEQFSKLESVFGIGEISVPKK